jgi:3-oxoadipate enol-lactonase
LSPFFSRGALHQRVLSEGRSEVVLLHSLALDGGVWDGVASAAGELDVTLRAFDLPGHGRSGPASGSTIEDMADQVARDLAGQGRFVVAGMSFGGCVAQALAWRHPDLVQALVLVDTTSWYGPTAEADWSARAARARAGGLSSMAEFQLSRWFTEDFVLREPELCRALLRTFCANDLAAYETTCAAMGAFDGREQIGSIVAPTEVIVGEADQATPPADAELIHHLIPGSGLLVVPECRHLTAVERPDVVVSALGRWV